MMPKRGRGSAEREGGKGERETMSYLEIFHEDKLAQKSLASSEVFVLLWQL